MIKARFFLLTALLILYAIVGCNNSGSVMPDSGSGAADLTVRESCDTMPMLWGLYDISIDPDTSSVEIVQNRTALFEANVTRFLHPPFSPVNLLTVLMSPDSNFAAGRVICDVTIKHPFASTKFAGFDVKGIVMGESGTACQWDTSLTYADSQSVRLLNADGWSRWWNQPEFLTKNTIFGYTEGALANHGFTSATTLNPFKYFCDELDNKSPIADVTQTGRGFFSSSNPGINTRRYDLQFPVIPSSQFKFKYAISASWMEPVVGSTPPFTQYDYSLDANQPEAFRLSLLDNNSTAWFKDSTDFGGNLDLVLNISDWQLLSGATAADEISGIYIESPTLFSGVINIFDSGNISAGPDPMTVSVNVSIPDVTPSGQTNQLLIVHVASAHPTTYEPQIPGISGYVWPQDATLAAHIIWECPIGSVNPQEDLPPVADASLSNPLNGNAPLTVHLDPSLSSDPDGTIVLYEWDFENDGTYDSTTANPDIVDHVYSAAGTYYVNLRVTDDDDLTDTLDIPLMIKVTEKPTLPEWSQLQNSPIHSGDIGGVSLTPPLTWKWNASFYTAVGDWQGMVEGSPIIGDGKVLVMYHDWKAGCYAKCFDADTGAVVWGPLTLASFGGSYQGTQTAAYGDGRFYLPGPHITARNPSDGSVIWTYVGPNQDETRKHGLVFRDGKVYVHLGDSIHIIDAASGNMINKVTVGTSSTGWQPFTLVNNVAYIQYSSSVRAYNLDTGSLVWTFNVDAPLFGTDRRVCGSPTVPGDGKVYFGAYGGWLYAVNQTTGAQVWRIKTHGDGRRFVFDTVAVSDGKVFYCEGVGYTPVTAARFTCVSAVDGSELWAYAHPEQLTYDNWSTCSPIVANGYVYAGCSVGNQSKGYICAWDIDTTTGTPAWTYATGTVNGWGVPLVQVGGAATDPAIVNNKLYWITDDAKLMCFSN